MILTIQDLGHTVVDGDQPRELFSQLNLRVNRGECISLMGDSGCGKTTLLNLIAGLEPIQKGSICLTDVALEKANEDQLSQIRRENLGIIFQNYNLLSGLNVEENISFSAKLADRYNASLCNELAEQLGIGQLLKKRPDELSGGEMQRVAIARTLSAKPQLLLADEPTGNLDDKNSQRVVKLLISLCKQYAATLIIVSHSYKVAQEADRIYHLDSNGISVVSSPTPNDAYTTTE
ncbi:ABC transporter ATP-binding protein [Flocculibacter collagenilyticus]|uniref:ABC transporter ATP-binding protein n=1 Tax=Flocculibacter collagenilyticus TaxID=2744479 RepID=UPI0018F79139|nr:ABC transporter ATP-binding protein [Flocculibacter collagenilyticus]